MVLTTSIKPAITELEKIYDTFAPLFGDALKRRPIITIQSRGRRKAEGWMSPGRWDAGSDDGLNEINVCAESLGGTVEEVGGLVLHEMCHHFNAVIGVRDCSRNQYHNEHFRDACALVGLSCKKAGWRGWARTGLSDTQREMLTTAKINGDAFTLFRTESHRGEKEETRLKKWTCGCTIIRAAGIVDVTCNRCGERFICV